MNIFILDENIERNVKMYVDKHVIKMPLETAQLLCTTLQFFNIDAPYKKAFINHPCTKWVRESLSNYKYLCNLGKAICREYTFRYNKVHACEAVIDYCIEKTEELSKQLQDTGRTEECQAMPDQYKSESVVDAYRKYYIAEKQHLYGWRNREKPYWIK